MTELLIAHRGDVIDPKRVFIEMVAPAADHYGWNSETVATMKDNSLVKLHVGETDMTFLEENDAAATSSYSRKAATRE